MQSLQRHTLSDRPSAGPVETVAKNAAAIARSRFAPGQAAAFASAADEFQDKSQDTWALVGRRLADVERDLILDTLRFCLGNRTRAAKMLGVSIRTMRNRLKEFALDGLSVPPIDQRHGT
jgi:DNA-binding NtrC family response regulator